MTAGSGSSRRICAGFTLIEALVAGALIGGALLSTAILLTRFERSRQLADQRDATVSAVEFLVEDLLLCGWRDLPARIGADESARTFDFELARSDLGTAAMREDWRAVLSRLPPHTLRISLAGLSGTGESEPLRTAAAVRIEVGIELTAGPRRPIRQIVVRS